MANKTGKRKIDTKARTQKDYVYFFAFQYFKLYF